MSGSRRAPRVAVVGGGISGLAAAHHLREQLGDSVEITLLEQDERLGGKLRTVELAGRDLDAGAEAFLARRPEVPRLLGRLGIDSERVHPEPASASIRAGGRTSPIPGGTVMGVPSSSEAVREVLSEQGLARVAAEADMAPVRWDGTDVSVGALLRERLGEEVVRRLVDPLLGGVYAGRADGLGLRATVPAIAAALDAGAESVLDAASAALPPAEPSEPKPPAFGALRGGYRRLIDELCLRARARVRLGEPVRALRRVGAGWQLEVGSAPAPETLSADAVVLAVPAPAARRLLADTAPDAAAQYGRVELASMVVVALAFPAGTELPAKSGVLVAEGERHVDGTPFTAKAFTFSSNKWEHLRGAGGEVLVRGSIGRFGDAGELRRDDAELVSAVRSDLAELVDVRAEPVDSVVARWGGGLPQYGPGHGELVARLEGAVRGVAGLEIAGASLHGVGVPACVATGESAAASIADHLAGGAAATGGSMESWPA